MTGYSLSTRSSDAPAATLFSDATVNPSQFRDMWSGQTYPPECELAAAVLDGALVDLQKHRYASGRSRQRLYWQAYQWVDSVDREWPFSFVNLCDVLGLSPEALRSRLLDPPDDEAGKAQAA